MSEPGNQTSLSNESSSQPHSCHFNWMALRQLAQCASSPTFVNSPVTAQRSVELQVETMSSISTRVFLYSWYAVLITALVVESNVGLQWVSRNFCGDATVSVYHLEDWNSTSCLSWESYWVRPNVSRWKRQEEFFLGKSGLDHGMRMRACAYTRVAWPPNGNFVEDKIRAFAASAGPGKGLLESVEGKTRACLPDVRGTDTTGSLCHRNTASKTIAKTAGVVQTSAPVTSSTTSPPLPTMPALRRLYKLRWTAEALSGVMDRELNRFLHVFISLASPLAQLDTASKSRDTSKPMKDSSANGQIDTAPLPAWKVYEVLVALEETNVGPLPMKEAINDCISSGSSASSSSADRYDTKYVYTYRASVTCWRSAVRCSNIVLPADVVIPANHSRLTITLIDVEEELAEATLRAAHVAARTNTGSDSLCFAHDAGSTTQRALFASSPPLPATTGVGVMYQRAKYTIGTIVFRYLFLFVTLVSTLRFLYRSRQAQWMLFEQKWTLALQVGLMFYLNPLYWWCIYAEKTRFSGNNGDDRGYGTEEFIRSASTSSSVASRMFAPMPLWHFALYYAEFHVPTYFVAITVCYIWGVIAGSFRWSSAAPGTPPLSVSAARNTLPQPASSAASTAAAGAAAPAPVAHVNAAVRNTHIGAASPQFLAASSAELILPLTVSVSGSQRARRRVRMLLLLFMFVVTALDMAKCFLEEYGPYGGWGEVTCRSTYCLRVHQAILYVLVGGILSSGVGLYWLRGNLARHPYLSTRPQQLACRIMIFMYFTGGLYCVVQVVLLETFYAQLMVIIYYQPLVQLSHLFVLTSFVNHMTYVYTTTQPSLQIPLRPSDPRWKTVGWSSRWYRWLDWHGGSLYMFFNEVEERNFYEVQVMYQLSKRERNEHRRQKKKDREHQRQEQQQDGHYPTQGEFAHPCNTTGASQSQREVPDAAAEQNVFQDSTEKGDGFFSWCRARRDTAGGGSAKNIGSATATAQQNLPPQHASALPTNTLSALSEPEETDWLLLPERHRSLSTVTQPSSISSESNDDHAHCHQRHDHKERVEEGEEGALSQCAEAREISSHEQNSQDYERAEGRRTPESTALFAMSPFPPGVVSGKVSNAASAANRDNGNDNGNGDYFDRNCAGDSIKDGSTQTSAKNRHASQHVLSRVSSRMLGALHGVESCLVDGTATFVDLLAEKCVDRSLQVLLHHRAHQRFVFFNLETAIDCLNLSHEAYAVQESKGDDIILTGIQVDASEVPRAALTLVERAVVALCGMCFKKSVLEPRVTGAVVEVDDGVGGEADATVVEDCGSGNNDINERTLLLNSTAAATPPASPHSASGLRCASQIGGREQDICETGKKADQSWSRLFAFMRGEGQTGATPQEGESPEIHEDTHFTPGGLAAAATLTTASSTSARLPLLLPHMNVEQYGYTPVAVLDMRGVQVVVARMNVSGSCSVHSGKPPRLTIAFRGTDNVTNVLEDIRFRQRTWKEMETPALLLPRAKVHSGFLELWMSLKEAVMNVVLQELRRQCVDRHGGQADVNTSGYGGEGTEEGGGKRTKVATKAENTKMSASPADKTSAGHDDVFCSAVSFSPRWAIPAQHGGQNGNNRPHCSNFLRLYVTGHSLGGALACLCAYSLRRLLLLIDYPEPDIVVYTFGQPRIGNSVFKQHYNRAVPCTFRVVNESDVVSGFNVFGGHHVGVQVNVDRHGNYISKPMYIERLLRPTRGRGLALLSHKLAAYANSLNAVADLYANGACPVRCLEPYMNEIEPIRSTDVGQEGNGEEEEEEGASIASTHLPQREQVEAEKDRAVGG